MSAAMERSSKLTNLFGVLLLVLGLIVDLGLVAFEPHKPHLIRVLVSTFTFNAVPGLLMCFLANRMDRVKLWAFGATIGVLMLLFVQFCFAMVMTDVSGFEFIGLLILRLPLAYLIAALLNAMPHVMDGYRGYRRDRELTQRAFEPIMKPSNALPPIVPPPSTTIRRRSAEMENK